MNRFVVTSVTYHLADEPRIIQPSQDAAAATIEHHNHIAERRRSDLRDVTTFTARQNGQAWRISVCLHAGKHGAATHEKALSVDTVGAAIGLAELVRSSATRHSQRERQKAQRQIPSLCRPGFPAESKRATFIARELCVTTRPRMTRLRKWSAKAN